jgi:hypothetical protein
MLFFCRTSLLTDSALLSSPSHPPEAGSGLRGFRSVDSCGAVLAYPDFLNPAKIFKGLFFHHQLLNLPI